jgi:D-3-phosphoglycerate dehydrogenase / 2-oxoglutarate reductase
MVIIFFSLFCPWQVNRAVFESSAGRLRVVGRAGVGIDNVDLTAATEHGCLVVNAPTANTVAAAEHGIALLASMARNVAQADAALKTGMDLPLSEEKTK